MSRLITIYSLLLFLLIQCTQPAAHLPVAAAAVAIDTTRSYIMLHHGNPVYIDGQDTGILTIVGNVKIIKEGPNAIAYRAKADWGRTPPRTANDDVVEYNGLYTPVGGKPVRLSLADGTRIWLNSGSHLSFPNHFWAFARSISVKGEAYVEVAHNDSLPLELQFYGNDHEKQNGKIRAFSACFNVKAYPSDTSIVITTVDGISELFYSAYPLKRGVMMGAGYRAEISTNTAGQLQKDAGDGIRRLSDNDIKRTLAWKAAQ